MQKKMLADIHILCAYVKFHEMPTILVHYEKS
jgi:hypothetical protein